MRRFCITGDYGLEYQIRIVTSTEHERCLKDILDYNHYIPSDSIKLDVYQQFAHWVGILVMSKVFTNSNSNFSVEDIENYLEEIIGFSAEVQLKIISLPRISNMKLSLVSRVKDGDRSYGSF